MICILKFLNILVHCVKYNSYMTIICVSGSEARMVPGGQPPQVRVQRSEAQAAGETSTEENLPNVSDAGTVYHRVYYREGWNIYGI